MISKTSAVSYVVLRLMTNGTTPWRVVCEDYQAPCALASTIFDKNEEITIKTNAKNNTKL